MLNSSPSEKDLLHLRDTIEVFWSPQFSSSWIDPMDWYLRSYGNDGIVPTYQLASEELCDEDALSMDFWPQHEFSTIEKLTPSMESCGVIVRDSSIKQQDLWDQPDYLLQQLCQPWSHANNFGAFPQEVQHDIEKPHQYLEDLSPGIQSFSDVWNDESMNWSTDIPRNSKKAQTQFTEKAENLQVPMLSTLGHGESSSEESTLHDLQFVMKQLSKETRICFRDAMYRLAKSSMQNSEEKDTRLDAMGFSSSAKESGQNAWASQIVKSSDTQTSVIDTTVTSLLFGEIMVSDPRSLQ